MIEDDSANLRLMLLLLNAAGHRASGAANGESGLAAMRQDLPDLVLCDGCLPDIDGFEVIGRVRADAGLARVPVIAVTGLARSGETDRLLAAGFDGCIGKPFDIKTFAADVGRFLER
ncbi:MAG TPA: response regulator [Noviherbaspirillum sp.]|nr:response regulator [Noviherbaspirillum sp.]